MYETDDACMSCGARPSRRARPPAATALSAEVVRGRGARRKTLIVLGVLVAVFVFLVAVVCPKYVDPMRGTQHTASQEPAQPTWLDTAPPASYREPTHAELEAGLRAQVDVAPGWYIDSVSVRDGGITGRVRVRMVGMDLASPHIVMVFRRTPQTAATAWEYVTTEQAGMFAP